MKDKNIKKINIIISFIAIIIVLGFSLPSMKHNHGSNSHANINEESERTSKNNSEPIKNPTSKFKSPAKTNPSNTSKPTKQKQKDYPRFDPNNISDGLYLTKNDFVLKIEDGVASIDGVKIVNKCLPVLESVASSITSETEQAFKEMQAAIRKENMDIKIISDYRSYETQAYLFESYLANDIQENTETYSARPGHSEHHLGEAIDIGVGGEMTALNFGSYDASDWVAENCHKFGFILRYPKNSEKLTGYMYEPWHFRYVGEELATILYNDGDWLTIEGYFGLPSEYVNPNIDR
ncbi:MAG: M15 family metallopeptidase [Clostridiaceae bacterium]|nr:M15 family metallopeptidase [Clostridiaceae bacterium]